MKSLSWPLLAGLSMVFMTACGDVAPPSTAEAERDNLVGAWRSQIHFRDGALAEMKDLEFMMVFNAGGTMTESSNYDGAPPAPPAYGVWKKDGPRHYEARYQFYVTKPPEVFEDITKGGGWTPAGRGILNETITLSEDGKSYVSTISFAAFDQIGKPAEGGGEGIGAGARMGF